MTEIAQTEQSAVSRMGSPSISSFGIARAYVLVFVASAAALILQLLAGRLLAPYIGSSLYTWTSIIGVFLAGISLGNWVGGRLADRNASVQVLGGLFLLSGIACLLSLVVVFSLGPAGALSTLPLLVRIFVLSAIAFVLPSTLLAMVTPVAIRQALPDIRKAGQTVGIIYALGTAGSLVGNFATGFILTAYFNTTSIVLFMAASLIVIGLVVGNWWNARASIRYARVGIRYADRPPSGVEGSDRVGMHGRFDISGNAPLACMTVAVASFASMGVELAASRILAPYLGLSLYSWTGIIGVVLAGIALGNFIGGLIADRWPSQHVLAGTLFVGGMGAMSILLLVEILEARVAFNSLGLVERILAETFTVFFVPVLILGMISPQVIRLAVTDLGQSGRISGEVYAWSTAGAIGGTFLTGWFLVSALGVHVLVFCFALVILLIAFVIGRCWRYPMRFGILAIIAIASIIGLQMRGSLQSRCTLETNYFCIRVGDEVRSVGPVKTLVLDHLVHSYVKLDDPTYLGYVHEQVQAEIAQYATLRDGSSRILVIGGGGYTYPRWVEAKLPTAKVEVVEIDPSVTQVAYDYLNLSRATRIVSHNMDGRQFVQDLAPKASYSLVVQDAVNDLSVPYHIMTREYNDRVRELLKADSIYLLTVIDLFNDGQLLRSAVRTMKLTFPSVQLLAAGPAWESGGANVWIIAGSTQGLDIPALKSLLAANGISDVRITEMPPNLLEEYVANGPRIILTDEYAPVDNLIAILFRTRG